MQMTELPNSTATQMTDDSSSDDEVRVVVVDDMLDIADTLAELLEMDGYKVVTAGDAAHALEAIERHRPHCVLLDIHMPGGDGCDLSRKLRELYRDDIVLIAVTGYDERSDRVAETFSRVDHYLRKPVDLAELRKLLRPLR
jgi:DNA-binding response OmpR family regulator